MCIDREHPSLPHVALKNKLMHCHNKEWGLDDASRLLQRIVNALDEDCVVVKDYFEKLKSTLDSKKDDPDFNKLQGFYLLSMGLNKPHQLEFDHQMNTLRDTKTVPMLMEPFDRNLRSKMMTAQKKHLTGDSKQLPLGDLSKNEYRKCGLIATMKIRPDEPRKPKVDQHKKEKPSDKPKPAGKQPKPKKQNAKETKQEPAAPKADVEQPTAKKAKKTKVPPQDLENVMNCLQELKVFEFRYPEFGGTIKLLMFYFSNKWFPNLMSVNTFKIIARLPQISFNTVVLNLKIGFALRVTLVSPII